MKKAWQGGPQEVLHGFMVHRTLTRFDAFDNPRAAGARELERPAPRYDTHVLAPHSRDEARGSAAGRTGSCAVHLDPAVVEVERLCFQLSKGIAERSRVDRRPDRFDGVRVKR